MVSWLMTANGENAGPVAASFTIPLGAEHTVCDYDYTANQVTSTQAQRPRTCTCEAQLPR